MRKASFKKSFNNFDKNISWDFEFIEKVYNSKSLDNFEKGAIFDGFVFRIDTNWQTLVEDLFIDCLNHDNRKYIIYTSYKLPRQISREMCRAIVIGLRYVDWSKIDLVKDRAIKLLVDRYNPFKAITNQQAKRILEFNIIRNYLAHYSNYQRQRLYNMYKNIYNFKVFREPSDFLMSKYGKYSTRLHLYINNFISSSDNMKRYLDS